MTGRHFLLLGGALLLVLLPVLGFAPSGAEFGGADSAAVGMIESLDPDYQPWATPAFQPPSGEVESLLFSLQAALGAGLIGYAFGRWRRQD